MTIFEHKTLPLKYLNYLYLSVKLISYAILLFALVFIINDCYHLYLKENSILQLSKLTNKSTAHLDVFLTNLLWGVIFALIKIISCFTIVLLIKFLIFKIPLTSKYLISLDQKKEISPILGRYLTYHFRQYTSINFSTLVSLNQEAEYEHYILTCHAKKNKFDYFLKKYDSSYINDIKF